MSKQLDTTKFHRQLGIVDPDKLFALKVRIIGVGGIGSAVALILAKVGVGSIEVFDPDIIEEANLPNQFYRNTDVGSPKVEALARLVADFSETAEVIPHFEAYDPTQNYAGSPDVVICAVDSMEFRKELWLKVKNKFKPFLYIETRMGGEDFRVYALSPLMSSLHGVYENTLYTSKQAEQIACTEKAIMYNVMMVASLVGSFIKMYVSEGVEGIPFEVLGNILNTMFLTTSAKDGALRTIRKEAGV